MTEPLWRKLLKLAAGAALSAAANRIRPPCPICGAPLEDIPDSDNKVCKNGHVFGPDALRVRLINDGDHHGDL